MQGPTTFLSLEREPQDAALKLEEDNISSKNGIKKAPAKLDKVYKTDHMLSTIQALEAFETQLRPKKCL